MRIADHLKDGFILVHVKPNSKKNEVLGFDRSRGAVKIGVAAPPEKGRANKEVVNFVSKELGMRVRLVKGATSKEKLLSVVNQS